MNAQNNLIILFIVLIIGFLAFDLGYVNRKAHRISFSSALKQSLFWILVAFGFAGLIYKYLNQSYAADFMSAYITEKMLSVDNLFIILLIFKSFSLEERYYHKVLFWGIMGAVIFRGIFISAGALIVSQFHWVLYIFGAFLIYTGIKFFFHKHKDNEVKENFEEKWIIKFIKKIMRFTTGPHHGKFFIEENGKYYATILFLVVVLVETTDIIFAVDSIPAVFTITQDPFIVFTSNIFAIMGLRALFFLIEGVIQKFYYLHEALSVILVFIGAKMLSMIFHIHISSMISFGIIVGVLILSIIFSILFPKKDPVSLE